MDCYEEACPYHCKTKLSCNQEILSLLLCDEKILKLEYLRPFDPLVEPNYGNKVWGRIDGKIILIKQIFFDMVLGDTPPEYQEQDFTDYMEKEVCNHNQASNLDLASRIYGYWKCNQTETGVILFEDLKLKDLDDAIWHGDIPNMVVTYFSILEKIWELNTVAGIIHDDMKIINIFYDEKYTFFDNFGKSKKWDLKELTKIDDIGFKRELFDDLVMFSSSILQAKSDRPDENLEYIKDTIEKFNLDRPAVWNDILVEYYLNFKTIPSPKELGTLLFNLISGEYIMSDIEGGERSEETKTILELLGNCPYSKTDLNYCKYDNDQIIPLTKQEFKQLEFGSSFISDKMGKIYNTKLFNQKYLLHLFEGQYMNLICSIKRASYIGISPKVHNYWQCPILEKPKSSKSKESVIVETSVEEKKEIKKIVMIADYISGPNLEQFLENNINDSKVVSVFIDFLTGIYQYTMTFKAKEISFIPTRIIINNARVNFLYILSKGFVIGNRNIFEVLSEHLTNNNVEELTNILGGLLLSVNTIYNIIKVIPGGNTQKYYLTDFIERFGLTKIEGMILFFNTFKQDYENNIGIAEFQDYLGKTVYREVLGISNGEETPTKELLGCHYVPFMDYNCSSNPTFAKTRLEKKDVAGLRIFLPFYKTFKGERYTYYNGELGREKVIIKHLLRDILSSEVCCQHKASENNIAPKIINYWKCRNLNNAVIVMSKIDGMSLIDYIRNRDIKLDIVDLYLKLIKIILYQNQVLNIINGNLLLDTIYVQPESEKIMFLDYRYAMIVDYEEYLMGIIKNSKNLKTTPLMVDLADISNLLAMQDSEAPFSQVIFKSRLNTNRRWSIIYRKFYRINSRIPTVNETIKIVAELFKPPQSLQSS